MQRDAPITPLSLALRSPDAYGHTGETGKLPWILTSPPGLCHPGLGDTGGETLETAARHAGPRGHFRLAACWVLTLSGLYSATASMDSSIFLHAYLLYVCPASPRSSCHWTCWNGVPFRSDLSTQPRVPPHARRRK